MIVGGIYVKLTIIETRTVPTVKVEFNGKRIIFHSKYDPLHEAQIWCKNAIESLKVNEEIVVVGLGAGYHIQALAQAIPNKPIIVIEFNDTFFKWFKKSSFYEHVTSYKNVYIKQFTCLTPTEKETIFASIRSTNLLIHKNGIDIFPVEYAGIKGILEDIKLQKNSIQNQIGNMISNFKKNILLNDPGIGILQNTYVGKPMILVSAGPSLDSQLPLLKKIRDNNNFIIGAVGTALIPLVNYGIIPDLFAITDPKATHLQLLNLELPETTLLYLSTAYHDTVILHKGPRRILWQKGFEEAEKMAEIKKDPTIQTGGSVATTLLDVLIYLGGESVALVGQDLAFTDGKSHANETHSQTEIKQTLGTKKVMNYDQTGEVYTANSLNLYRKWFESYSKEHHYLQLYNCTEGGAYINNWKHISLHDYYIKYS